MVEHPVIVIFCQLSQNQVMLEARRDLRRSSTHHFLLLSFAVEQTHGKKCEQAAKFCPKLNLQDMET